MDEASLVQKIKQMEAEVLALKTTHERGLGLIEFHTARIPAATSSSNYWYLKATGGNPNTFPFFAELAVTNTSMHSFSGIQTDVDTEENSITWHFYPTDIAAGQNPWIFVVASDNVTLESDYEN